MSQSREESVRPPGTSPLEAAETADHAANHAMRWWILAVLGVAQLMVILDGTIIESDRCREPVLSVKGEVIDLWYSGKAQRR